MAARAAQTTGECTITRLKDANRLKIVWVNQAGAGAANSLRGDAVPVFVEPFEAKLRIKRAR